MSPFLLTDQLNFSDLQKQPGIEDRSIYDKTYIYIAILY